MTAPTSPQAAFLIIGNEILSGRTQDKNVNTLALKLGSVGVRLAEVRIVPDIEERIVGSVRELSKRFDYVFSSGGIGPTHDDITADSMAKAFDVGIDYHEEAMRRLAKHYENDVFTPARQRMARIPLGGRLIDNPVSTAPGFWIENVAVCAGVPRIFEAMIDGLLAQLTPGAMVHSRALSVNVGESFVADLLRGVATRFPDVDMGSYPFFRDGGFGASLVLRATDRDLLDQAYDQLRSQLVLQNVEVVDGEAKSATG